MSIVSFNNRLNRTHGIVFSVPLSNLDHVNNGLGHLVSTNWWVEPSDSRICTLIWHRVDEDRKYPHSKNLVCINFRFFDYNWYFLLIEPLPHHVSQYRATNQEDQLSSQCQLRGRGIHHSRIAQFGVSNHWLRYWSPFLVKQGARHLGLPKIGFFAASASACHEGIHGVFHRHEGIGSWRAEVASFVKKY